jgi:hypothetical protein
MKASKLQFWVLVAVCALLFCVCLVNFTYQNLDFPWTSLRLAPSFAFWQGYPIYSTTIEPPWVMIGYGPLYPLMYTPSLLATSSTQAVAIATMLSQIYLLGPLFLLARLASNDEINSGLQALTITALLYLLFLSVPSLYYVLIRVAADASAFGFLLLATWFLLRCCMDRRLDALRGSCIAGALLGLSIACKVNLAPALATFTLWCFWFCGLRATIGLLACAAAGVACVYGIACINSDPQAVLLNLKVLNNYPWGIFPGTQKYTTPAEKAFVLAIQLNLIIGRQGLILLALILVLQPFTREAMKRKLPASAAPTLAIFFLLLALNMLVPAGATISKWGGGVNSWALFTLPLTLCAVFSGLHYARNVGTASSRFLLLLSLPWAIYSMYTYVKPWELKEDIESMPGTYLLESSRLVKECKGTCYLPFDPLAHLLIDHVFRPNVDVIYSFYLGGEAADPRAFNAALPQHLEKIYLPKATAGWGIDELKRLTGFHESGDLVTTNPQQIARRAVTSFIILTPD